MPNYPPPNGDAIPATHGLLFVYHVERGAIVAFTHYFITEYGIIAERIRLN
jgi:hypothetical protein